MRQTVKAVQIKGTHGESLEDDILYIIDKATNYDKPVQTEADLPITDNQDGDIRLVMGEGRFYRWNNNNWEPTKDAITESRQIELVVASNNQLIFNTNIPVGVLNGIANIETVQLLVNGIMQSKGNDFLVEISGDQKLKITWISNDFLLETTDSVLVVYDILINM